MEFKLDEPVAYAVYAHRRLAMPVHNMILCERRLHASLTGARAAADGADMSGEFDEVEIRAHRVAAPGGEVRPGPVAVGVDPHLGWPVLHLVEGHGGPWGENHWFETCGDVVYASLDDAQAFKAQACATGKYDEVMVLACPVSWLAEED